MIDFPELLPVGEIREILPNIHFVTGQMVIGEGEDAMHFSRNMTIVKDGEALTLINTIRLDDSGLEQLDALGSVRNVVRLGAHHGRDDAFYLDRYEASFWAVPGMEFSHGEEISTALIAGKPGPCSDSSVFTFETASKPEVVLLLSCHNGILVTCDSLQNFRKPDAFFNETAKVRMLAGGFLRPANIGPGWLSATNPKQDDFTRLQQLAFKHVFSGHGEPCLNSAHEQYSATFSKHFGA